MDIRTSFFILFDEEQIDPEGESNAIVSMKIFKDDDSSIKLRPMIQLKLSVLL